VRPDDAARRHSGEFFVALKVGGERVAVRPGRAAGDAAAERVAGMPGGVLPGLVVGHRAFDGEEALITVGDDEEERRRRLAAGPGRVADDFQMRRPAHAGRPGGQGRGADSVIV